MENDMPSAFGSGATIRAAVATLRRVLLENPLEEGRDPLRKLVSVLESADDPVHTLERLATLRPERIAEESVPDVREALVSINEALCAIPPGRASPKMEYARAACEAGDEHLDLPVELREKYYTRQHLYARHWPEFLRKKLLPAPDKVHGSTRVLYFKTRVLSLERNPEVAAVIAKEKAARLEEEQRAMQDAAKPIDLALSLPMRFSAPAYTAETLDLWNVWARPAPRLTKVQARVPTVARLLALWETIETARVIVDGDAVSVERYCFDAARDHRVSKLIAAALKRKCRIEVAASHPNFQDAAAISDLRQAIYAAVVNAGGL